MKPQNDLERLLMARNFGPQHYPEVFRLLRESPLVFLLPYHPELPGTSDTVRNGDALPPFVIWESAEQGPTIPIFSSPHCAREAWREVGADDCAYVMGEMLGQDLFELLAFQPNSIVINPASCTSAMYVDATAVKKLADGSILDPEGGEMKEGIASVVDPADYPTDFLQPLFCFLRGRPQVRAVWLLQEDTEPGAPISYVFVLKVTGNVQEVERDFRVVARAACPKDAGYGVTLLDPTNEGLVQLTTEFTPFYAAPDFRTRDEFGDEGLSSAA
jgi:hypothetical protein